MDRTDGHQRPRHVRHLQPPPLRARAGGRQPQHQADRLREGRPGEDVGSRPTPRSGEGRDEGILAGRRGGGGGGGGGPAGASLGQGELRRLQHDGHQAGLVQRGRHRETLGRCDWQGAGDLPREGPDEGGHPVGPGQGRHLLRRRLPAPLRRQGEVHPHLGRCGLRRAAHAGQAPPEAQETRGCGRGLGSAARRVREGRRNHAPWPRRPDHLPPVLPEGSDALRVLQLGRHDPHLGPHDGQALRVAEADHRPDPVPVQLCRFLA
mmetsp:Transcript_33595/g.89026  ORF Transcript_33595/g.89026 Transcript_33595/m.89026 type:complete len:264 (+) Transcript_33595:218-1009(+)